MTEIVDLDACALSQAIHQRQVSCREVMSAYLARIDAVNPLFNAIVSRAEPQGLLAQADERDAQLGRGQSMGWMHGMPQAIKDLSAVRGMLTTRGSPLLVDNIPTQDGLMVERMRASGALFVGRTNVPEFALGSHTYNPVFGITRNAYDRSRTAGGSSGGAAVALAHRMLPVADGSDMGGSLRNPAAYNNVFGFRPSQGRVPMWPVVDCFLSQLGTEGPMGRTVQDVAMLLSVQAGGDPRTPLGLTDDPSVFAGGLDADMAGSRIGYLGDLGGHLALEPGIDALCRGGLRALADMGCRVQDTAIGFSPDALWQCWINLRSFQVAGGLVDFYNDPAKRAKLKPEAVWEIEAAQGTSANDVYRAAIIRTQWYEQVCRLFGSHDFLVQPTAQVFPFDVDTHWPGQIDGRPMDTYHRWMEVVVPWTLAGLPVLSVPVGFSADGLPMGMQIIGRPKADLAVLKLGAAYDAATGWVTRRRPAGA